MQGSPEERLEQGMRECGLYSLGKAALVRCSSMISVMANEAQFPFCHHKTWE